MKLTDNYKESTSDDSFKFCTTNSSHCETCLWNNNNTTEIRKRIDYSSEISPCYQVREMSLKQQRLQQWTDL